MSMDLDATMTKTKITYIGEILPNNDRSNAILAQRRKEEEERRAEAERVSEFCRYREFCVYSPWWFRKC